MNRQRILGAIAFPTFMLAWAAGAMLVLVQLQPAAALDIWVPAWERDAGVDALVSARAELAAVPTLDDPADIREAALALAAHSEVMNGSWQPADPGSRVPVPEAAPEVSVAAPAAAETASAAAPADEPTTHETPAPARALEPDPVADRIVSTSPRPIVHKRPVSEPTARLVAEKDAARRALEAGRFAEAYARLRPTVADARGDAEYLGLLALAAMRTGSQGEALVIYQHLAALEPEVPRWRVGLALAQESLGLDASGVYRDALALGGVAPDMRELLRSRLGGGGPTGFS